MTLYEIELAFETDEQVERAWFMRDEIIRHLSEDGKAEMAMAIDRSLLGLTCLSRPRHRPRGAERAGFGPPGVLGCRVGYQRARHQGNH
ncbi:MAG: hypothetical protein ACRDH8_00925 [Actinomycetota bacterium]